jgi:thymidine kinase
MLAIAIVLVALAVLAGLAALRLRSRTPPPAARPEPEVPKPHTAALAEAVPVRARISGEVARPRVRTTSDALDTLDALLAELESATVRIDGADAFDESSVSELEGLAERLEAAADSLAAR